ncbi:MAG: efflux RND transporter periplasmic adaptor subunit [Melioribacteraceae bacterium]|nr:efflux RND transporter periplasmic adaptor subunit [Melioribacteraceae bacterium]MCF8355487.1 efflux RND transporter periplasmic adaptor subunit [Melioribacteraceae bacterium]MCF8394912.1 efflux RND transporter periplasmic adaptor subunit [Melioribacteraceae bacterium]MCF8420446.1 efflux RND transporter periplasmic adaptor subunit [Melioribacteraceae bacterium]
MAKGKQKKSKKKLFIFGGLGLLLIVVIVLVVLSGNKEEIISVQTEDVAMRDITQVVSATGKINPVNAVELRPEVTAEIVELPVEEGTAVKKGQLLIRLKPEIYVARRNRAQASLEAAQAQLKIHQANLDKVKSEYDRMKGMAEKGLASDQELESAKASMLSAEGNYEVQKAQISQAMESLNDAKEELAKTTIYSPMDGVITQLNVELSERVLGSSFSQGTHLMTVADLNQMEARVEVDENDVVLVEVGDTSYVEIDAFGDRKFVGLVSQIGNSAQTTGLGSQDEVVNFEIRIRLLETDERIRPGMSCDSDIETETRLDVISVPIQSVTARSPKPINGGEADQQPNENEEGISNGNGKNKPQEVVFVVDNNEAKMLPVKTGISDDNFIEIIEGLDGTEKVVSGPYRAISKDLTDGAKVMETGGAKKENISSTENE